LAEFDFQWAKLPSPATEYSSQRVEEFLAFTELPETFLQGKSCLDAGCGNGRWTWAMMQLGGRVTSFDVSEAAVEACKAVNANAYVADVLDLTVNRTFDFVLCWGVIQFLRFPKIGFKKVAGQVKPGGILHVMLYSKSRETYIELRERWKTLTHKQRLDLVEELARTRPERTAHGWWDALNPRYAWTFSEDEVRQMFIDNGFTDIKRTLQLRHWNINMQGKWQNAANGE
jgi:SAM-dependent methyltransferase